MRVVSTTSNENSAPTSRQSEQQQSPAKRRSSQSLIPILTRSPLALTPSNKSNIMPATPKSVIGQVNNDGVFGKKVTLTPGSSSSAGKKVTVGSKRSLGTKQQRSVKNKSVQTELINNAQREREESNKPTIEEEIGFVTSAVPSESYWKQLAEERRVALEETLVENMELHDQVEELQKKVQDLEEQNAILVEIESDAVKLANTLKGYIAQIEGSSDDDNSSDSD